VAETEAEYLIHIRSPCPQESKRRRSAAAIGCDRRWTRPPIRLKRQRVGDTSQNCKGMPMASFTIRTALVALIALGGLGAATDVRADGGTVRLSVLKGGWFIGASGGSGTLTFRGRNYPLSIGGLSAGLVFGASQTYLSGRVSNIYRPSDVAGVYGAGGAGAAFGPGVGAIVLTNQKGAVLELSGRGVGLMVNADFSGLAISLR
jgi:hypothetical protein